MSMSASVTGLVRDPAGRFSPLKLATLALMLLPGVLLAVQWRFGLLGPRPLNEVIHGTGLWAIRLLVLSLAVTPARAVLDWPRVVLLRRMIGVGAACYAVAHLVLFALDKRWNLLTVASEIALRFYLTVGFVALLGLLALAITSTDGWQRRLGERWKRLHRIVYWLAGLALFHYAIQSKSDVSDAVFLAGLFAWLMLWRRLPRRWQNKLWPLPELALSAGMIAAAAEALWYAARNGVDPVLVIAADFDLGYGPRPAVWALVTLLAVAGVAAGRRLLKRRGLPQGAVRGA